MLASPHPLRPLSCLEVGLLMFVHFGCCQKEVMWCTSPPPPPFVTNNLGVSFVHFAACPKKKIYPKKLSSFPPPPHPTPPQLSQSGHDLSCESTFSVCWVQSAGDVRGERLIFELKIQFAVHFEGWRVENSR